VRRGVRYVECIAVRCRGALWATPVGDAKAVSRILCAAGRGACARLRRWQQLWAARSGSRGDGGAGWAQVVPALAISAGLPPFPGRVFFGSRSPDVIAARAAGLTAYVNALAAVDAVVASAPFGDFVGAARGEVAIKLVLIGDSSARTPLLRTRSSCQHAAFVRSKLSRRLTRALCLLASDAPSSHAASAASATHYSRCGKDAPPPAVLR
jgi:hypothetical protein